jgi:uncharacterized protein (DUF1499 family)
MSDARPRDLEPTRSPQSRVPTTLIAGGLLLGACAGEPPDRGDPLLEGLPPCPASPNCVHTGDRHPQGTEPFVLAGEWQGRSAGALFMAVDESLSSLPRTRVVDTELAGGFYFRAESMSRVFRFVDDVEVRWVAGMDEVQVRSASRVGRSDWGVNEARVERLRELLVDRGVIR